jgi:hypothetical protein
MDIDEEDRRDRARPDDRGNDDHSNGKSKQVEIEVNGKPVEMAKAAATGMEIKQAAIAQGVNIQLSFVLQQELPNGSSKIVGDGDTVQLRKHLSFTAIAPDDNS